MRGALEEPRSTFSSAIIAAMNLSENITLLHGECIDLLPKIPDSSINTIITDPPYFLGMTHNGTRGCFNDLVICKPFYEKLFAEYKRVLRPDGCVYFFCDWRSSAFYYPIFDKIVQAHNLLVWVKHGRPTQYHYGYGTEFILFSGKIKKSSVTNVITDIKSFNLGAEKTNGEKVHPTQKPIELMEKFIIDSTDVGDTVLDTFAGSGTTGIACIRTGRKFIGMELNDRYFEIAKNRIEMALKEKQQELFCEAKGAVNE